MQNGAVNSRNLAVREAEGNLALLALHIGQVGTVGRNNGFGSRCEEAWHTASGHIESAKLVANGHVAAQMNGQVSTLPVVVARGCASFVGKLEDGGRICVFVHQQQGCTCRNNAIDFREVNHLLAVHLCQRGGIGFRVIVIGNREGYGGAQRGVALRASHSQGHLESFGLAQIPIGLARGILASTEAVACVGRIGVEEEVVLIGVEHNAAGGTILRTHDIKDFYAGRHYIGVEFAITVEAIASIGIHQTPVGELPQSSEVGIIANVARQDGSVGQFAVSEVGR